MARRCESASGEFEQALPTLSNTVASRSAPLASRAYVACSSASAAESAPPEPRHQGFRPHPWLNGARKVPLLGWVANQLLSQRLQMWHDIAFGFLTVHEHLEHEVHEGKWTHNEKHEKLR